MISQTTRSYKLAFFKKLGLFLAALLLFAHPIAAQDFSATVDLSAQDTYLAIQNETLLLVDVRTPQEWAQSGIAQGAHPISMLDQTFLSQLEQLQAANPDKSVAFICASGRRSALVQSELVRRGFENIFSVYGGTTGSRNAPGWIGEGLPVTPWSPS